MSEPTFNPNDSKYLRTYGANLNSETLITKYRCIRARYEFAGRLGGVPTELLLLLAAEHPCPDRFPDEVKPAKPIPTPSNNSKPKRKTAGAK